MTKERLRTILNLLGWGSSELATRLKLRAVTVTRWMNEYYPEKIVPENVAEWLETVVAPIEAMPLPVGWFDGGVEG